MILYVSMFHISHINSCIFDIYRWFENVILALHTNVKRTWYREPRVLRRAGRPISCDTTPRRRRRRRRPARRGYADDLGTDNARHHAEYVLWLFGH